MTSRILLTGGTGFFGRALLRHFIASVIDAETSVCVLSRDPQRFQTAHPDLATSAQISFVQGDIQERESLPWNTSFTHVLHAATDSTVGPQQSPLHRFWQIVDGTSNVLDLAVATGASRFLLTSSGGIYGPQPPDLEAIPEDWPGGPPLPEPATAYSQAKRAAEHLCALYRDAHGLKTVIARCFAFVGPDLPLDVHFAIGNFIRDALRNQPITVAGDGSPLRTYLDQSDLAHWLWTLLLEGVEGESYNVGSDEAVSIRGLAHLVKDLLAPHLPVEILAKPHSSAARNRYIPDITKAKRLHGLNVTIPLDAAIRRTALAKRMSY
jgi:UDP-glucuronate decarboxylase